MHLQLSPLFLHLILSVLVLNLNEEATPSIGDVREPIRESRAVTLDAMRKEEEEEAVQYKEDVRSTEEAFIEYVSRMVEILFKMPVLIVKRSSSQKIYITRDSGEDEANEKIPSTLSLFNYQSFMDKAPLSVFSGFEGIGERDVL